MGMYDTYIPCSKLKTIITEETGIKEFYWQTKALECELLELDINEDLSVTLNGIPYLNSDFTMIDSPYINHGNLLLEFENSKLKSILWARNPAYAYDTVSMCDFLLVFNSKGNITSTRIYDFDTKTPALLKRNYLMGLYLLSLED